MTYWPNQYANLTHNVTVNVTPSKHLSTQLYKQIKNQYKKPNHTIEISDNPTQTASIENKTDIVEDIVTILLPYLQKRIKEDKKSNTNATEYKINATIVCCYYVSDIKVDDNNNIYPDDITVLLCEEDSKMATSTENIEIETIENPCDTELCAYNFKGNCMYKHVFGVDAEISDKYDTGCSGFIPKNWREL